jgi:hypothetical protein
MNQILSDSPYFGESPTFAGTPADYHRAMTTVDGYIDDLRDYAPILTARQRLALSKLGGGSDTYDAMTIDDVTALYALVRKLRNQLVDPTGTILDGANIRLIPAFVSSLNQLISTFIKSTDRIKELKDVEDLKASVIEAMKTTDKETQERFYLRMQALESRE